MPSVYLVLRLYKPIRNPDSTSLYEVRFLIENNFTKSSVVYDSCQEIVVA